jgi:signal transduction histidine kinase
VHDATVRFSGCPVVGLSAARQEAAYRIAQEALHNALRHGHPRLVAITLSEEDETVVLEITDDGDGFDAAAEPGGDAARRLGLSSMRERAHAVGGRLTVTSQPGGGATVRLVVPTDG